MFLLFLFKQPILQVLSGLHHGSALSSSSGSFRIVSNHFLWSGTQRKGKRHIQERTTTEASSGSEWVFFCKWIFQTTWGVEFSSFACHLIQIDMKSEWVYCAFWFQPCDCVNTSWVIGTERRGNSLVIWFPRFKTFTSWTSISTALRTLKRQKENRRFWNLGLERCLWDLVLPNRSWLWPQILAPGWDVSAASRNHMGIHGPTGLTVTACEEILTNQRENRLSLGSVIGWFMSN